MPIGNITPKGWLGRQLELEAEGMTGHLEEIYKWCKLENSAWPSPNGRGDFGWEELPYWLKGYGDLGYVLKSDGIIKGARKWVDSVLASQEADGYFDPRANKTGLEGKPDLWPHMVMCNVLESFYEFTGDERVLPFLTKCFKWLNTLPAGTFGAGYWPAIRFGDNIQSVYWLYNRISYVNTCSAEARRLTPKAKTLTAPYGTVNAVADDTFIAQLGHLDVDIIAYQDEVGCLRMGPTESAAVFSRLRRAHDRVPQRVLWVDVELFAWKALPTSRPALWFQLYSSECLGKLKQFSLLWNGRWFINFRA